MKLISYQTYVDVTTKVSEGLTVQKACDELGIGMRTFFSNLAKDTKLQQLYAQAQRARAQAHFERIGDIADQVLRGELDPAAARVAIDAWKWTAGRMDPKKYGDRVIVDEAQKPSLSRSEALAQLKASGLRMAEVFNALTDRAEAAPGDMIELSAPTQGEGEDDLSDLAGS